MRIILFFVILLIGNNPSFSQDFFCREKFKRIGIIKPSSGLNLRKGPSLLEEKILTIPKNEEVLFCFDDANPELVIDNLKGRWLLSEYKGLTGYLFSGYLEIKKCVERDVKLVVPEDGSIANFPLAILCKPYQGIYEMSQSKTFKKQFEVKSIELVDTTVSYDLRYFAKIPTRIKQPLFLLSGLELNNKKIEGRLLKKMFFPFESKVIWNESNKGKASTKYLAYAKGEGIINENPNELSVYKKIKNYELWIRKFQEGEENIDILLFKTDLTEWVGNYQGGAWIYWIGHLNEDKIPDIIIKTSETYKGWDYKLLLSDPSQKDKIYKILKVGAGSPL